MRIWTRLGVTIAILAVIGFFAFKALKSSNFLRARQKQIAITLAGAGALLFLIRKVHSKPLDVQGEEAAQYESPFYAKGTYWGVMLMLSGAMVGGANHAERLVGTSDLTARLGSATNLLRFPKLTTVNARSESASPPLEVRLQGIGYSPNPARCSAIINGQTLLVGENAGGVKVLSINAGSVTVEANGDVQVLTLK